MHGPWRQQTTFGNGEQWNPRTTFSARSRYQLQLLPYSVDVAVVAPIVFVNRSFKQIGTVDLLIRNRFPNFSCDKAPSMFAALPSASLRGCSTS